MGRSTTGPLPFPDLARWMTPNVPALQQRIVLRAYRDIDIGEHPPGSNRSTSIDGYLRRARVPESIITSSKGYWCAAWVGCVAEDAGADIPQDFGACESWVTWARGNGTWYPVVAEPNAPITAQMLVDAGTALPGYIVIFGIRSPEDANHCGILTRHDDYKLCISGNTGLNGYSTNGVIVDSKPLDVSHLLGFIKPMPAAG